MVTFFGEYTKQKNIKNDALPHKPNYVKRVLSGDLTFFCHAADYFSYLTNEKMLLQSSLFILFLSGIVAATIDASDAAVAYTLITYFVWNIHKLCAYKFSENRKKETEISVFYCCFLSSSSSVLSYCY